MYHSKREVEVLESYDIRIKEYVNGRVEMTVYDRKINKIKDGYELQEKNDIMTNLNSKELEKEQEIRKDNIYRSYSSLIDYAIENSAYFKTFITLTFKENLSDINIANKRFNTWCLQVRRQYPDLMYLGSPEYQERGAVHYHLMTNISIDDKALISLQSDKKNMYDVKYWEYGFSSVFDLKITDDKFSVAAYLSKYYFKDIDNRLFGRKKILKSNNLKKPKKIFMNTESIEYLNYLDYLTRSKELQKIKSIPSSNKYAPSLTVLTYQ
jgi:hypothetical protein